MQIKRPPCCTLAPGPPCVLKGNLLGDSLVFMVLADLTRGGKGHRQAKSRQPQFQNKVLQQGQNSTRLVCQAQSTAGIREAIEAAAGSHQPHTPQIINLPSATRKGTQSLYFSVRQNQIIFTHNTTEPPPRSSQLKIIKMLNRTVFVYSHCSLFYLLQFTQLFLLFIIG